MTTVLTAVAVAVGLAVLATLIVWVSPFLEAAGPPASDGSTPAYRRFIVATTGGGSAFKASLLRLGFLRQAVERLWMRWIARAGVRAAGVGDAAPDARLLRLDASPTTLHAVMREVASRAAPAGVPASSLPLVLNFGSYS